MDDMNFTQKIFQASMEVARISTLEYQYNNRTLVYQHDKVKLYHYKPKLKKPYSIPLLVIFATVNRPEILDLFPERSFIRGLLDNGMDVYLLDWGYPEMDDKNIAIADYVTRYLHHCVEFIRESSQQKKINLLGICQGGLLCLCYSILHSSINKLVLISAPIDFHTEDNVIGKIFRKLDVDTLVDLTGNISGVFLTNFFISLRPFELIGKKYLRFMDNLDNPERTEQFLRVEKWLYDAPDQTGKSFSELITDFYHENKLVKGKFSINGKKIRLNNLNIPVLNVMAAEDEIIPVSASRVLANFAKNYQEQIFPSGHIGIYISEKVGKTMPKAIADWCRL